MFITGLKFVQENIVALVAISAFIGLGVLFWTERGNDNRKCLDLVTAPNGKYSRDAIGQCFGILVAVWAPIFTTLQGKLEVAVLVASLAYLGACEAYGKYMRFKSEQTGTEGTTVVTNTSVNKTERTTP